ncbi:Hypothetical predicted protein, partial [Marmota monax]
MSPLVLMKISPPPLSADIRSLPCWYPMRMAAFRSPCQATQAMDTGAERQALRENVYPKLREFCRENYGLEFQ